MIHDDRGLDDDFHAHHVETYDSLEGAPYHDFVREFTAESFDAEAWADLFEDIGARFAGPVAAHHDGWSDWDSEIDP